MNRSAVLSVPEVDFAAWATVTTLTELTRTGWSRSAIRAQLAARRWQRCGRAVVLHNSVLSFDERSRAAVLNCGPRAALTAFTAAEFAGLTGWHRDPIHVIVPAGARIRRVGGIPVRVHWCGDWPSRRDHIRLGAMRISHAVIAAAATFDNPRPACAIIAAAVQQRLALVHELRRAVERHERLRHHALLTAALNDIEGGAQALSEIDFARMCRRAALPEPARQAVRLDRFGRRRYLDVEWRLPDGRVVVVEVDGALHMIYRQWWDDTLRQNEIVINGSTVLRFPSALVRSGMSDVVLDQLRRALA